ncbi:MAG: ATP-binding protein [Marmoricola sp.]
MDAQARPPLPEGRVALLFTDIQGSTALLHRLGDVYGEVLDEHDRVLREVWEEFGGVEVSTEGDAFFVGFGDHRAAVEATKEVLRRCREVAWPGGHELLVRMALHSGEPRVRGRDYWGVDVHYAARLCSTSHGGQVVLSATMRQQVPEAEVATLGYHAVKDFPTPHELFHLVVDGSRPADFPPPRTMATIRRNLPSIPTPIIGRDRFIEAVTARLVGTDRLVTMIGPGGIGKTRTAIACAEAICSRFPDGAAFVALAPVETVADALWATTAALSGRPADDADPKAALLAELAGLELLVVLDNAEHLPDLGLVLVELLAACPGLRLLVTSQASLDVRGERVVRLDALEVPQLPTPRLADLVQVSSVAMVLDRVRAKEDDFELSEADREPVAELCRRLEGIPLALELAAARLRVVGPTAMLRALEDDINALTDGPRDLPDRQASLRAALAWTTGLLSTADRDLFAGLGAFASAWTLEEVEQLCADGDQDPAAVWAALSRLLDLSLLIVRGDGRFTMAERVRRYARELLAAGEHEHQWRQRHGEVMASAMDARRWACVTAIFGTSATVEDASEETQHAVDWAAAHDPDLVRRLVAFSAIPYTFTGRLPGIADLVLELTEELRCEDRIDGLLMLGRAAVLGRGAHYSDSRRDAALAALACLEEHGHPEDQVLAAGWVVDELASDGRVAEANELVDRVESPMAAEVRAKLAGTLAQLRVHIATTARDYLVSDVLLAEMSRSADCDPVFLANYRADNAMGQGMWDRAAAMYTQALAIGPQHFLLRIWQIQLLACALAALGADAASVELTAAVSKVNRERQGTEHSVPAESQGDIDAARARLSAEDRDAAEARGRLLTFEQLCDRARELGLELVEQTKVRSVR